MLKNTIAGADNGRAINGCMGTDAGAGTYFNLVADIGIGRNSYVFCNLRRWRNNRGGVDLRRNNSELVLLIVGVVVVGH